MSTHYHNIRTQYNRIFHDEGDDYPGDVRGISLEEFSYIVAEQVNAELEKLNNFLKVLDPDEVLYPG